MVYFGLQNGVVCALTGGASTNGTSGLVTINAATTGAITLNTSTIAANYSGSAADLVLAFAGTVTTHTGTVEVTDALSVANANIIDAATSGVIENFAICLRRHNPKQEMGLPSDMSSS